MFADQRRRVLGERRLTGVSFSVGMVAPPGFAAWLFFEANGLAASALPPYDELVPGLVEGWLQWATERIEGAPPQRRVEAETAIALLDGLLLLRRLAGAAARAATRLGVR